MKKKRKRRWTERQRQAEQRLTERYYWDGHKFQSVNQLKCAYCKLDAVIIVDGIECCADHAQKLFSVEARNGQS